MSNLLWVMRGGSTRRVCLDFKQLSSNSWDYEKGISSSLCPCTIRTGDSTSYSISALFIRSATKAARKLPNTAAAACLIDLKGDIKIEKLGDLCLAM